MIKEVIISKNIPAIDFSKVDVVLCKGQTCCDYDCILTLRNQCMQHHISFYFISTGDTLIKDGKFFTVSADLQEEQANKAHIDHSIHEALFQRLARSRFRSRFTLSKQDRIYIQQKGWQTIETHAHAFVASRLAPATIKNDGRQTPMHGHPVFKAQHASATCCRSCLSKWHRIPSNGPLTLAQQHYVVTVIMEWIVRMYYKKE